MCISDKQVFRINEILRRLDELAEIDERVSEDLAEDMLSAAENRLDTFEKLMNAPPTVIP